MVHSDYEAILQDRILATVDFLRISHVQCPVISLTSQLIQENIRESNQMIILQIIVKIVARLYFYEKVFSKYLQQQLLLAPQISIRRHLTS